MKKINNNYIKHTHTHIHASGLINKTEEWWKQSKLFCSLFNASGYFSLQTWNACSSGESGGSAFLIASVLFRRQTTIHSEIGIFWIWFWESLLSSSLCRASKSAFVLGLLRCSYLKNRNTKKKLKIWISVSWRLFSQHITWAIQPAWLFMEAYHARSVLCALVLAASRDELLLLPFPRLAAVARRVLKISTSIFTCLPFMPNVPSRRRRTRRMAKHCRRKHCTSFA